MYPRYLLLFAVHVPWKTVLMCCSFRTCPNLSPIYLHASSCLTHMNIGDSYYMYYPILILFKSHAPWVPVGILYLIYLNLLNIGELFLFLWGTYHFTMWMKIFLRTVFIWTSWTFGTWSYLKLIYLLYHFMFK